MLAILRTALLASATAITIGAAAVAQTAPAADTAATAQPKTEATAAAYYAPQKVVYHINGPAGDDGKGYNSALGNIRNDIEAVGADNLDLRVVLHGDGVELMQLASDDFDMQSKIINLRGQGVRFLLCNNTLKARNIDPASLFEVAQQDVVPSGVAELGKLQMEGFAYIKP